MSESPTGCTLCFWCNETMTKKSRHHIGPKQRGCCSKCFATPTSNYRRVYGMTADDRTEECEVKRADS